MRVLGLRTLAISVIFVATMVLAAPAQTFELFSFDGTDGMYPARVSLVQGRDGQIYGTTAYGGPEFSGGTVFRVSSGGRLTTLYSFCQQGPFCADGETPFAGVIQTLDGSLYGTTTSGGANGNGTVFKISSNGTFTTIHSFCAPPGCGDGASPDAALLQGIDGNLYGTASAGGVGNGGTIFKLTLGGVLTTLHSFAFEDGAVPYSALVQGTDGNFYGTTYEGGANNKGTVFMITPQGSFTLLHSFDGSDGASPIGALVQASNGTFYGTTSSDGAYGDGTIFEISRRGLLNTLHSFNSSDGSIPEAGLVQASDGNFYGTTEEGGANSDGTVYKMTPRGALMTIHTFCGQPNCTDGSTVFGGLVQATDGTFYGTTYNGGRSGDGTIYRLSLGLSPFVALVRGAGKIGQTGGILGQGFTGTTGVMLNGVPANFTVVSDTYIRATVPEGATTGYVMVSTPSGVLKSNIPFHVIP